MLVLMIMNVKQQTSTPATMVTARTEDVSYGKRCYIQGLRHAGWTYDRTARDQNLPRSTVWRICHTPATAKRKGKRGRKVKTDTPTPRHLVLTATATAETRQKPFIEIAQEIGITASASVLRTAFAEEGYCRRVARKKPYLDDLKMQKWLQFALDHANWTGEDWRKVI